MYRTADICPLCEQGSPAFFNTSDKTLLLMCEECNVVWLDPRNIKAENALYPETGNYNVPGYSWCLTGGSSGWASLEEIRIAGWESYVD